MIGCIDASACNYDSLANTDNGSCIYPEEGYDCDGNAVCNYASVDFVGNESINEYEGVLYFNLESYSQAGISTDGYTANIIVNGDSIPLNHDGCITYDDGNCGNNNGWYVGVPVEAGATYSWSVTVETCGGGQTINCLLYTSDAADE